MNANPPPAERVGLLFIHGIGRQARYGHLEPEVAGIVRALNEQAQAQGLRTPVIRARSRPPALRGATNSTWSDGEHAPVVIEVERPGGALVELHCREVWWADLGDAPGFSTLSRLYTWALGMWLKPETRTMTLAGQQRTRFPERDGRPSLGARTVYRAYLALVGLVVFLPIPITIVLRVLRIQVPLPARVLAEYLGDVKLYQDPVRAGTERVEDLGLPPRVSIRARMVNALVEMALGRYDRWYVFAHSLGSVVALNGLMETEQALPNYLADDVFARALAGNLLIQTTDARRTLTPGEQTLMLPPRSAAVGPDMIVDRSRLFAGLRGVLTYGCPLERFRLLWPTLVPIHREAERSAAQPAAFSPDTTWFNVYDPSDPVASRLRSFGREPGSQESHPVPVNIPYRSGWVHLVSHIQYLRLRASACAARCAATWVVEDKPRAQQEALWAKVAISRPHRVARDVFELAGWLVLLAFGLIVASSLSLGVAARFGMASLGPWPYWLRPASLLASAAEVAVAGVVLLAACGAAVWCMQRYRERATTLPGDASPPPSE